MNIFDQEKADGLESLLNNNSVTYQSVARCSSISLQNTERITAAIKSANPNQVDLFYLDSILSSVGWNANDDVFDPEQMWAARHTPEDKQFNYMHDESDIIGHITGSYILDKDGNIYTGDETPEQYHLACQSVLYKKWSDETLQERVDKIIAEIAEDKWFVSMECLFPDFDYAIITPKGDNKVIARSKDTAFLTKHLRAYGGSGEYNGNKVGRLLKKFVFSGKGLVDNPANKNSIILSFKGAKASKNILGVKMEELENLKKEVADLKASNQLMVERVKAAEKAEINSEIETANAKVSDLEKTVSDMQKTIDELKNVIALKDSDNTKASEEVSKLTKELTSAKSELDTIKVETEKQARAAKLKEAGVNAETATKIIDQFITADISLFDTVVAAYQTRKPQTEQAETIVDKEVKITEDDLTKSQAGIVSDGVDDANLQKTKAAVLTFLENNLNKGK